MQKIFIIEDDATILEEVSTYLRKWNYDTKGVTDFHHCLEEFNAYDPHLVVLDINLPVFDGFYWCNQIRTISKVPIVFLSSRQSNMDIVMAMNMGGDDYIQKPFAMDILVAKITALLRRTYAYGQQSHTTIEANNIYLDTRSYIVTYRDSQLELTKNEFRILYELMSHKGEILSRNYLISKLWDDENFIDDNTLTVNVNRVRKKLEDIGATDMLMTKRGKGYYLTC